MTDTPQGHATHDPAISGAFQYMTQMIGARDMQKHEEVMNRMGADGWELVSALPLSLAKWIGSPDGMTNAIQLVFKRRIR
jgi:hypothetical protein